MDDLFGSRSTETPVLSRATHMTRKENGGCHLMSLIN